MRWNVGESNESSLIKLAVALAGAALLLHFGYEFFSFFNGKTNELKQKEIENRKKQNESIGYKSTITPVDRLITI